MNDTIRNLIREHEQPKDFSYVRPTMDKLKAAEGELGLTLPEQYVEFLLEYGDGGIGGFEFFGVGAKGNLSFLDETMHYRSLGLPGNLIVIENCDEWVYCLDAKTGEVVSWSPDGEMLAEYPDFDSLLLEHLNDAIDNM